MVQTSWHRWEFIRKISAYYYVDIKMFFGRPKLFFKRLSLVIFEKWLKYTSRKNIYKSDIPIEVVIPSIEKDYEVLPYTIRSIREYINHPIQAIHIIAPKSESIVNICKENNCNFIDEKTLLPIKPEDINYNYKGLDRNGWIFQQLIKLNTDTICKSEYILAWDSDTVIINPFELICNGKDIFYFTEAYCLPYAKAFENIFKKRMDCPVSLIAHSMLFRKSWLKEVRKEIGKIHNIPWYEAIINNIDRTSDIGFSEYESYGNFAYEKYPDKIILKYWFNQSVFRRYLKDISLVEKKYKSRKLTLSFHSYDY